MLTNLVAMMKLSINAEGQVALLGKVFHAMDATVEKASSWSPALRRKGYSTPSAVDLWENRWAGRETLEP